MRRFDRITFTKGVARLKVTGGDELHRGLADGAVGQVGFHVHGLLGGIHRFDINRSAV